MKMPQLCVLLLLEVLALSVAYRRIPVLDAVEGGEGVSDAPSSFMEDTSGPTSSFYMVQMADPQLGLKNMDPKEWSEEKDVRSFAPELQNLHHAVESVKRMADNFKPPKLVMMSGDFQNFWSQEGRSNLQFNDLNLGDYGKVQAEAVQKALEPLLTDSRMMVKFTPGNHDLDDDMNSADLDRYRKLWRGFGTGGSTPDRDIFTINLDASSAVRFIAINSQFYYLDKDKITDKGVKLERKAQSKWLGRKIQAIRNSTSEAKAIVMLTHIPPFLGEADEQSGWANWGVTSRESMMKMLYDGDPSLASPDLWLCGHFHGNVRALHERNGKHMEIMTTGSVGTAMLWDNNPSLDRDSDEYLPADAIRVGDERNGGMAFFRHIMDGNASTESQSTNIPARIRSDQTVAGVRVIEFYTDGHYRHKWFTLEQFREISGIGINDATMADAYEKGRGLRTPA